MHQSQIMSRVIKNKCKKKKNGLYTNCLNYKMHKKNKNKIENI